MENNFNSDAPTSVLYLTNEKKLTKHKCKIYFKAIGILNFVYTNIKQSLPPKTEDYYPNTNVKFLLELSEFGNNFKNKNFIT